MIDYVSFKEFHYVLSISRQVTECSVTEYQEAVPSSRDTVQPEYDFIIVLSFFH